MVMELNHQQRFDIPLKKETKKEQDFLLRNTRVPKDTV